LDGTSTTAASWPYTYATQKTTNNAESVVIKADCTGTLGVKSGSDYAVAGKQITWTWNSKSGKPPGLIPYADIFENTGASACSTTISYMESYYVPGVEPAFSAVTSTSDGIEFNVEVAETQVMIKAENLYIQAWTPLFLLKIEEMACNKLPIAVGTPATMNFVLATLLDIDGGPVANNASVCPDILLDLKTAAVTFDSTCPPISYVLDSIVKSDETSADVSLTPFFSVDVATGIFKASGYHTLATA
jgi:hypothetical protein